MSDAATIPVPTQFSEEAGEAEQLSRFQLPDELVQMAIEYELPVDDLMVFAKPLWIKADPNGLELAEVPMIFGAITDTIVTEDQELLNNALESLNEEFNSENGQELLEQFRLRIFCRLFVELNKQQTSNIFQNKIDRLMDELDRSAQITPRELVLFCKSWYEFIGQLDYHRECHPCLVEMMAYYRANYDVAMAGFETWKQATTKHYARLLAQE